jgi:cytosine deaminase
MSSDYLLKNAHIPVCLLDNLDNLTLTREGLVLVDIAIEQSEIVRITPADSPPSGLSALNLEKSIVFPCFVDMHTHLDKGHIWERSCNPTGTFTDALTTVGQDSRTFWHPEDIYRRMEFGLKCSYAHGTRALRTHLDSFGSQGKISLEIFQALQQDWSEKITLQAVSLVPLDYYLTPAGIELADLWAEAGQILGGVAYINPHLESQLEQVFKLALERNLSLDFHVDENDDPESICLQKVAEIALKYNFNNPIVCDHCCSLSVQNKEVVTKTINLVKAAEIGIVSLPMCNLFLQDRNPSKTPFWRGITQVHELKQAGVSVAFASDNVRDPFYGFGDHDMLEVFSQAVKIGHLDTPYSDWCQSVNQIPARLMGLAEDSKIKVGSKADLVIFQARYYSELLSRPQSDRQVLRGGKFIDTTLPDYRELDDLLSPHPRLA